MAFRLVLTAAVIIGAVIETSTSGPRIVLDGPSDTLTAYLPDGRIAWQGSAGGGGSLVAFSDDAPATASGAGLDNGEVVLAWAWNDPSGNGQTVMSVSDADGTLRLGQTDSTGTPFDTDLIDGAWAVSGETWQNPAYNANWAGATAFGTLTGLQTLQYHLTPEDEVNIGGCFAAGATAPGTAVFQLPAGYRPLAAYPLVIGKITGGVTTWTGCYVSTAGNLNLNAQLGSSVTAGAQYIIPPQKIPLRNLP